MTGKPEVSNIVEQLENDMLCQTSLYQSNSGSSNLTSINLLSCNDAEERNLSKILTKSLSVAFMDTSAIDKFKSKHVKKMEF